MNGLEPETSVVGSNHSTNWATTIPLESDITTAIA